MIACRFAAPATALVIFFSFSALYFFGASGSYYNLLSLWGIPPFTFPFVDMSGGLAAWECARLGIDVVEHDPCDVLGRAYYYSPLWMHAASVPLGVSATTAVGWTVGLMFLASLALLPRPTKLAEVILIALATTSTMVVYAVERGNPDLIVFFLTTLIGYMSLWSSRARFLSYPVVIFLALFLKYYPIVLMILSLRERLYFFITLNLTVLLIIVIFILSYLPDLERGIPLLGTGSYYTDIFSAQNLPFGLVAALNRFHLSSLDQLVIAGSVYILMLIAGARVCWHLLRNRHLNTALSKLTPQEATFLVMGGTLIVGCFFAWQNVGYRGIFLLFIIPGLLAISRNSADRAIRVLGTATTIVVIFIMWGGCIQQNLNFAYGLADASPGVRLPILLNYFWLLRELAWWWVVSVLTALLLKFVWSTQSIQTTLAFAQRRTS